VGGLVKERGSKLGMMRTSLILRHLRAYAPEFSTRTHYRWIKQFKDNLSHNPAFSIGTHKGFRQRGRPETIFYFDKSIRDDISTSEFQNRYWAHYMRQQTPE